MPVVRRDEEPLRELPNAGNPGDIDLFIASESVEGILYVLFDLSTLDYEDFTLGCGRGYFVLIDPDMICVAVILRDLLSLRQWFESILLQPPHLPVVVSSGHHLVVIFRVESQPLDGLAVGLLGEVKVCDHAIQQILLMIVLRLLTIRLNP